MKRFGWLLSALCLAGCTEDELVVGNRAAARADLAGAQSAFRDAATRHPGNARAHELLGNTLWALSDLEGARAAWLTAVQLEPRATVDAQLGLARIDSARGDPGAALDRLDKLLDRTPTLDLARVERALVLLKRGADGDAARALVDLELALKARPDDPEALFAREAAQLSLGKPDEALATCERLQKAHPESTLTAWAQARLAAVQSRRADVILHLRQARQAADAGWNPGRVRDDPAFRFMWDDPDFSREF